MRKKGTFKDTYDGTIKSVYEGKQGIIEVTLLKNKSDRDADVYCTPTHHYCNLGCVMCHLTKEGVKKPMIPIGYKELISGVNQTVYKKSGEKRTQSKKGWLSFMGVGEPLLNFGLIKNTYLHEEEIKSACDYEDMTYSLATMMPNRNLESIAKEVYELSMPLKVHFSMHSPFTEERLKLIPSTNVSVEDSLEMLIKYKEEISQNKKINENFKKFHTNLNPTEIHYTLIEGQNDTDAHLNKTIELLKKFPVPFKILSLNPIGDLKKSKRESIWIKKLKEKLPNLKIKFYSPPGHKIGSSCGEFTKHYYLSELETKEEQREFLEWKKKYEIFD